MADFSTPPSITTPGSAVADQLQNILATKRANDRQAMLDQLNQQNVQSQIRDRDAATAYNQERIAGLTSDRNAQEVTRRMSNFSKGQPLVGSDLDYVNKNSPSMVVPGQEGTQPLQPGDQGPEMPSTPASFYGSPKEVEADKHTQLQKALMERMGSPTSGWDQEPDGQKELEYFNATGRSIPDNVLRPNVGGKHFRFDEASGKYYDMSGKEKTDNSWGPHDVVDKVPRPPRELQDPPLAQMQGTRNGKPVLIVVDRKGKATEVAMPEGVDFTGKAAAPPKAPLNANDLYDSKAFALYENAVKSPSATKESRQLSMQNAINTIKDPLVKKDVIDIFSDAQMRNMPAAQLIAAGVLNGSQDHVDKVKAVLSALRGQ